MTVVIVRYVVCFATCYCSVSNEGKSQAAFTYEPRKLWLKLFFLFASYIFWISSFQTFVSDGRTLTCPTYETADVYHLSRFAHTEQNKPSRIGHDLIRLRCMFSSPKPHLQSIKHASSSKPPGAHCTVANSGYTVSYSANTAQTMGDLRR